MSQVSSRSRALIVYYREKLHVRLFRNKLMYTYTLNFVHLQFNYNAIQSTIHSILLHAKLNIANHNMHSVDGTVFGPYYLIMVMRL